jgi:hypothetical protein
MKNFYDLCTSPNIIQVIQEGEMCRACSTYGIEERCTQGFGGETSGKEITWKPWA